MTVADASGNPIPGATGTGSLLIGTPVTATLSTTPTSLPAGSGTVTATLQIASETSYTAPLEPGGRDLDLRLERRRRAMATTPTSAAPAESTSSTSPTPPHAVRPLQLRLERFPRIRSNRRLQVYNNELVALTQASERHRPDPPDLLVGHAFEPRRFSARRRSTFQGGNDANFAGFSISNNHVYTSAIWYRYYTATFQIFDQFGETHRRRHQQPSRSRRVERYLQRPAGLIDWLSRRHVEHLADRGGQRRRSAGRHHDGDRRSTLSGVQGEVLVVDTTNPAKPIVIEKLSIPGMAAVTGISVQGNQAFVIGTERLLGQPESRGLTGNVVVAMLDLTNPQKSHRHLDADARASPRSG